MRINFHKYAYYLSFLFAWHDLWIGIFIDKNRQTIYILPIPTLGIRISWMKIK